MKEKLSATVDKDVLERIREFQRKNYAIQGMNWSQLLEFVLRTGLETLDKKRDISVDL